MAKLQPPCEKIVPFETEKAEDAANEAVIVGAFWYLLSVERNDTCWQKACEQSGECNSNFLYCGNQYMEGYNNWSNISSNVMIHAGRKLVSKVENATLLSCIAATSTWRAIITGATSVPQF
ncbi:unnamed protein product [Ilex paraguariensis]|uniref:Uncharacterized protein n=1 Tax=Ilex paraguariensis TaxID=185542 RepID=A0ABC8UQK7_9AQUA